MIKKVVEELRSKGYEVEHQTNIKNGVSLDGIVFKSTRVAPVIYWEEKFNGMQLDEVVSEIEKTYKEHKMPEFDVDGIISPEFIKEHAMICLQKRSQEDIIKKDFFEIEMYVRVMFEGGSYKVTESVANKVPDIWDVAMKNTAANTETKSLLQFLGFSEEDDDCGMYIVRTNAIHGAGAMLVKENLRNICEKTNCEGVYILPSSIHECLILPDNAQVSADELISMVKEVNSTVVEEQDILSNSVYYYSMETNEFSIK